MECERCGHFIHPNHAACGSDLCPLLPANPNPKDAPDADPDN
jgi:hypothetical protein